MEDIELKEISNESEKLNAADIENLVPLTGEKNESVRYRAFLLLKARSLNYNDVYPYTGIYFEKLKSVNSYERVIAFVLLSVNAKWDKDNIIDFRIDEFTAILNPDEKPTGLRVAVQSLSSFVPYKPQLLKQLSDKLINLNLDNIKDTMKKLVLFDIVNILTEITQYYDSDKIKEFINMTLTGGILDAKQKKSIAQKLSN